MSLLQPIERIYYNFLGKNFFSNTHNDSAYHVLTTALQCIKAYKLYTLAGFEPEIFLSGGGRNNRYATPPSRANFCLLGYCLLW
jgi:hypothetical protein